VAKVDNAPAAKERKAELRRRVLEYVKPARVFDGFCGAGVMWSAVWRDAESYVGCDVRDWSPDEPMGFRRFVADNLVVLRAIDLAAFNVFDFDAYAEPWAQALVLARRRAWGPGERGAIVVTEGGPLNMRLLGQTTNALAELVGMRKRDGLPHTTKSQAGLHRRALSEFCKRSRVKPLHGWSFQNAGGGRGFGTMLRCYSAVVFEGQPTSAS
jgi:hypothetical protein